MYIHIRVIIHTYCILFKLDIYTINDLTLQAIVSPKLVNFNRSLSNTSIIVCEYNIVSDRSITYVLKN